MKEITPLLLLCIVSINLFSQVLTKSTTPQTIQNEIIGYQAINSINLVSYSYLPPSIPTPVTPIDGDTTTEGNGVYDFANIIQSTINISNGNITSTPQGKIWTLKINIPNALNIGLHFSQFNLSPTAEMYIYNDAKTVLKFKIKKADFTNSDSVSISSLKGNSIIVYIIEPGNFGAFQSNIFINRLIAGFQEIGEVGEVESNLAPTTNCIPHIQCYPGKISVARSVARVIIRRGINTVSFCTGTLINNELNNGRAYFLTAFHCIDANDNGTIEQDEINALRTTVFQFHFWRTQCNGSVNNTGIEFEGAILRASYRNTDMVLLELTRPPGIGDGVNYSGWYRLTNNPASNSSFIIHHPQTNEMRYTQTSNVLNFLGNLNYWQAYYSIGVVDRGSSGAALFNEYNQILGQLKGGWSNCNYTNFSDRYGKISQSWLGTGQANGNLQNWLSPSENQESTGLLNLTEIPLNGPDILACTTPGTFSTIPGLLDITYEWVVSSGMQVQSGQNTPTANIAFTSTSASGTVTLILRSPTKGKNRQYTISKTVTRSSIAGDVQGTYNSPNGSAPLIASVPRQLITYNNVCTGEYIHCSMSIPAGSVVTWNGYDPGVNWYQSGNDLYFYLTTVSQQTIFNLTVSNSCGTRTIGYGFQGVSGSCGGPQLRLSLSPNPSSTGTITASLINLVNNNNVDITEIKILDKLGSMKKHIKLNGKSKNVSVDISSLVSDVYNILVFDGKIWVPGRFIKN